MPTMRVPVAVAVLVAAFSLAAGPALAQDSPAAGWLRAGPYAGVAGLIVFAQDSEVDDPAFPTVSLEFSADTGFGVAGFVGYRLGNGLRVEAELAYRGNDLDEVTIDDPAGAVLGFPVSGSAPVEGTISSFAGLLNAYYDFDTGRSVIPYVGLGLGFATVKFESSDFDVDDSDTVLAYQARAGLALAASPTTTLFGGYTYFATADPTIAGADFSYGAHNLEVGFRFGF